MKTKLALFTLASASLLTAVASIRAEDPVPPTPPVHPPASATAAAKPAGGSGRPGGQRGERLEILKEKLGLTPEQIETIKPILEKDHEKLVALRENAALTREQKGGKMREILKSSLEAIKPILTPEQVGKWKAEMEQRRDGFQERRAGKERK